MAIEHRETTRAYSEEVRKMTDMLGLGLESEVKALRRCCRLAWDTAEKSRLCLARHEADHFCDCGDFLPRRASGAGA